MESLLALAAGVLYAAGIYLMLRRRLAQIIIGLALLSNGTNMLIFTAGGLTRGRPPVLPGVAVRAAINDPMFIVRRSFRGHVGRDSYEKGW